MISSLWWWWCSDLWCRSRAWIAMVQVPFGKSNPLAYWHWHTCMLGTPSSMGMLLKQISDEGVIDGGKSGHSCYNRVHPPLFGSDMRREFWVFSQVRFYFRLKFLLFFKVQILFKERFGSIIKCPKNIARMSSFGRKSYALFDSGYFEKSGWYAFGRKCRLHSA